MTMVYRWEKWSLSRNMLPGDRIEIENHIFVQLYPIPITAQFNFLKIRIDSGIEIVHH